MISPRHAVHAIHAVVASLLMAAASLSCGQVSAQDFDSQRHRFRVVTVARGLEHPWGLAFLPDGRMLVTERPGRLRIVERDGRLSSPLSGVPPVVAEGQDGLLDVAPAPDFAQSRMIYWSFSEPGEGGTAGTTVARGTLGAQGVENVQVIFRQEPKVSGRAHFGSRLVFTPDGFEERAGYCRGNRRSRGRSCCAGSSRSTRCAVPGAATRCASSGSLPNRTRSTGF